MDITTLQIPEIEKRAIELKLNKHDLAGTVKGILISMEKDKCLDKFSKLSFAEFQSICDAYLSHEIKKQEQFSMAYKTKPHVKKIVNNVVLNLLLNSNIRK